MNLLLKFVVMFLMSRADIIVRRINDCLDKLFVDNPNEEPVVPVCAVCDEILDEKNFSKLPIHWLRDNDRQELLRESWQNLSPNLRNCYEFDLAKHTQPDDPNCDPEVVNAVKNLLISPRSSYIRDISNPRNSSLTCCKSCRMSIQTKQLPIYAIKNNYCLGSAPDCLTELTETELAFVTPVKHFGYCFSWTGGKYLEGSMSFFRVKPKSIARSATQLDILGLQKDVVVIYYGKMSKQQKRRADQKSRIRVDKVMAAIEWLISNNSEWQKEGIVLEQLRREVEESKFVYLEDQIMMSVEEEQNITSQNNIEKKETFRVYFPDGSLNEENGGQGNIEKFKEMISAMKDNGYEIDYECNFASESVADFKDNNFVTCCPLQFPYGRGGLNEPRIRKKDNSLSRNVDVQSYIKHLSRLSQRTMHQESFVLILYNMTIRQLMLRSATWKVRNSLTAKQVSTGLTKENLKSALKSRKERQTRRTNMPANKFIDAIDAVAKSIPHTNGATKRARIDGEAYAHKFGFPNVFLTIAPDDENSFLVSIYTLTPGHSLSKKRAVNMTDEEIAEECTLRKTIRIKFPGICALFFERALDIVIKEVIGWDDNLNGPRESPGAFGTPLAYIAAVEEQGRGTLHAHIIIWIKDMNEITELLHSPDRNIVRHAKRKISDFADSCISTEFLAKKKGDTRETSMQSKDLSLTNVRMEE